MNYAFVGAHPDDAEWCAGGTISKLVRKGDSVRIICCSHKSDSLRGNEQRDAGRALCCNTTLLGGEDTKLNVHDLIEPLEKKLEGIDTIFTHGKEGTHQDHRAVNEAVLAAGRNIPNIYFWEPLLETVKFEPQRFVVIPKEVLPIKLDAVKQHKSQVLKYEKMYGIQNYIERLITSQMVHRGSQIGQEYAEAFEVFRETDF